MALLPDRYTVEQEIGYFCNDITNRGVVLILATGGSGVALDNTKAVAGLPLAGGSGTPLGMLMNDMVSLDLSRFHINFYKDVMPVGYKCTLLKRGWVVTDQVVSGVTPTAGASAYLAPFGQLTTNSGTAKVGTFLSSKDENGFAKVEINLP